MPMLRLLAVYAGVVLVVVGLIYRQEIAGGWTAVMESGGIVARHYLAADPGARKPSSATPAGEAAAPDAQQAKPDLRSQWHAARRAFHQGNPAQAEALYLSLTAAYPDELDLLGEFGDFYYYLGRLQEASDIYFGVAEKLIAADRRQDVKRLLPVIHAMAPDKARILRQKLSSHDGSGVQ